MRLSSHVTPSNTAQNNKEIYTLTPSQEKGYDNPIRLETKIDLYQPTPKIPCKELRTSSRSFK